MACFADVNVSQGSVATYARCGGMFNNYLTENLPGNLPLKKFYKSVKIWQNYGHESVAPFFWLTMYVSQCNLIYSNVNVVNFTVSQIKKVTPRTLYEVTTRGLIVIKTMLIKALSVKSNFSESVWRWPAMSCDGSRPVDCSRRAVLRRRRRGLQ